MRISDLNFPARAVVAFALAFGVLLVPSPATAEPPDQPLRSDVQPLERAHAHWTGALRLLIDVKSEGTAAWPVIERTLSRFPQLMTTYRDGRVRQGPVTAVISGNRDRAAMEAASVRRSFYDDRLSDFASGPPSS